ncbi:SDR family NAD(P)-dependent oxidoreductase [Corynebacterium sp. H78]|uniref:SDR family NAD(P)-dependent oxidoreductase n=1 Tax=Corynebacterium sp. H78 TaxID=3133417 RepID=UPI00309E120E
MRSRFTHGPALPAVPRGRALVTGASSGIGWACAEALRDAGFHVIGTSRKGAAAPHPDGIDMVALDMGASDGPQGIATVMEELLHDGPLDVIVANAGESQSGPFEELPRDALERLFQVNVLGQVELLQRALPSMREAGRGRIVVIGSMLGGLPLPHRSSYVASKAAIRGFALALRGEVAKFGIGVTVMEPGSINTGLSQRRTKYGGAADSPYTADVQTMLRNLDGNEATGIPASEIAETVLAEILADRPVPLVARGSKAQVVVPLTRLLPTQATLALMRKVHGL